MNNQFKIITKSSNQGFCHLQIQKLFFSKSIILILLSSHSKNISDSDGFLRPFFAKRVAQSTKKPSYHICMIINIILKSNSSNSFVFPSSVHRSVYNDALQSGLDTGSGPRYIERWLKFLFQIKNVGLFWPKWRNWHFSNVYVNQLFSTEATILILFICFLHKKYEKENQK